MDDKYEISFLKISALQTKLQHLATSNIQLFYKTFYKGGFTIRVRCKKRPHYGLYEELQTTSIKICYPYILVPIWSTYSHEDFVQNY